MLRHGPSHNRVAAIFLFPDSGTTAQQHNSAEAFQVYKAEI